MMKNAPALEWFMFSSSFHFSHCVIHLYLQVTLQERVVDPSRGRSKKVGVDDFLTKFMFKSLGSKVF